MRARMWPYPRSGVFGKAAGIEKQEETKMRLKLLSPGEMNEDQKQTYDESIAGKRGAPPPPMMAWLKQPGNGAACHASGRIPAVRYIVSGKTVRDRDPGYRTALDFALRMVRPQTARAQRRHGPKIIDDIRDRRTPKFDDPKGQMIYEVSKSLHEGHGVSKTLYDDAVKVLTERGLVEIIGFAAITRWCR